MGDIVAVTWHEPPLLAPMAAGSTGMPANPAGWIFEPKWDGVRAIARVWDAKVTLTSRLGNDVTSGYPELAAIGPAMGERAAVLDGEIIAFDDRGHPSFERLQRRMHVRADRRALWPKCPCYSSSSTCSGSTANCSPAMLPSRAAPPARHPDPKGPSWQTAAASSTPHRPTLAGMPSGRARGLHGQKLASSDYAVGKRSKAWSKIKCGRRREFVVGGWSDRIQGSRSDQIGSLAVGWRPDPQPVRCRPAIPQRLLYAGQVGSGLNEFLLGHLRPAFTDLARRPALCPAAGTADGGPLRPPAPGRRDHVQRVHRGRGASAAVDQGPATMSSPAK